MSGVLEDDFAQSLRKFQLAEQARRSAAGWLQAFETALVSRDAARIGALFHEDSHWRDILAFTWDMTSVAGRESIAARLTAAQARTPQGGLAVPSARNRRERARGRGCHSDR